MSKEVTALPPGYRRNFVALLVDYVCFGVALALFNPNSVLPAFVGQLTDSAPVIGLVSTVFRGGWLSGADVRWALAAFAGAFATALFDTVSSEIGQLYGRHPFLITTLKRVPVGTDGAVSAEGTLAGLAAGAVLGALGWAFGLYGAWGILFVTAGAFIGTTFESIIGALGSAGKRINNELLNFINTVVGAAAAGLLYVLFAA